MLEIYERGVLPKCPITGLNFEALAQREVEILKGGTVLHLQISATAKQPVLGGKELAPSKDCTEFRWRAIRLGLIEPQAGLEQQTLPRSSDSSGPVSDVIGDKLSQSEMDALRGQVQRCWNIPAGAAKGGNLKVSVRFHLDASGALIGSPEIIDSGGASGLERAAAEAARRAVSRCSPYTLPSDKYDAWSDVVVQFDPAEMF